jgi:Sec-independent protein translocase protein TatA
MAKRPSAIVNKDAVARVQAQQAALKAKATQQTGVSPADMQSLGEGLGDALRTFRQAVADVRHTVDPEMRTIQAEMDAAQKELEQSIEAAKELPTLHEEPPKQA